MYFYEFVLLRLKSDFICVFVSVFFIDIIKFIRRYILKFVLKIQKIVSKIFNKQIANTKFTTLKISLITLEFEYTFMSIRKIALIT